MMFKVFLSSVLFVGMMAVSVNSNATILVNHHNQPYQEYARHATHHRAVPKASHPRRHHRNPSHHSSYHRSDVRHSKVVDHCFRMKNGQHIRVC